MHGLEKEIEEWRAQMLGGDAMNRDTVRELEAHLRDAMDGYVADGLSPAEALEKAKVKMGAPEELNLEFRKVNDRAHSARRLLWLISGHVTVCFALGIGNLVGDAATRLVSEFLPEARIELPLVLEGGLGGGKSYGSGISVANLAGIGARILCLALLCVLGIRWLQRRAPRIDRLLVAGGDAIKLVLLLAMICWLGLGHLSLSARHPLEQMAGILLFAVAISTAAMGRSRDRAQGFEKRNHVFAGYFVVSGVLMVGNFLASLAGFVVIRLVPDVVDPSSVSGLMPSNLAVFWYANGYRVFFALAILLFVFAFVLVGLWRRSNPGHRLAGSMARRGTAFLLGWAIWTFSWTLMGSLLGFRWLANPASIQDNIGTHLATMARLEYSGMLTMLFWILLVPLVLIAHLRAERLRGSPAGECLLV